MSNLQERTDRHKYGIVKKEGGIRRTMNHALKLGMPKMKRIIHV